MPNKLKAWERQNMSRKATLHKLILPLLGMLLVFVFLSGCRPEPEIIAPPIIPYTAVAKNPAASLQAVMVEPDPDGSELVEIKYVADISYIMVQFRAKDKILQDWQRGDIYIIDESTDSLYGDIATMPVIGPLFSKPPTSGETGYVMLNNPSQGIQAGSVVTAVLGRYKREHVTVK